jgi:hypothetical protein
VYLKYAGQELRLSAREITFGEPALRPRFCHSYPHAFDERDKGAGDPM